MLQFFEFEVFEPLERDHVRRTLPKLQPSPKLAVFYIVKVNDYPRLEGPRQHLN